MDPHQDTPDPVPALAPGNRSELEQVPGTSHRASAATTSQVCSESERDLAARRETPPTPSGDRPEDCSETEGILGASPDTPGALSGESSENRSEFERIPAATAEVLVPGPDRFFRVADVELAEDILTVLDRLEIGSMHRIQALVPSLGLTVREFLVLTELTLHPEGLTNGQVTGIIGLPSATVAELLTALEACGLVSRVDDPFDRRCVASFATERAQQMLVDARGRSWQIEDLQRELMRDLDVHQLDGVLRFLGRATDRAYRRSRQLRERPRPGRATRGGSA